MQSQVISFTENVKLIFSKKYRLLKDQEKAVLRLQANYDPKKSLYYELEKLVQAGIVKLIDIHMHIFNSRCVAHDFLSKAVPFFQKFLNSNFSQKYIGPALEKILHLLTPDNKEDTLDLTANYINEGAKSIRTILEDGIHIYSGYAKKNKVGVAVCPLEMDFTYGYQQKSYISYEVQHQETMRLANFEIYKGKVLPFIFVDPRRENLLDQLTFGLNAGAVGFKVYTPLGYLPTHPKLMPVLRLAAQKGLPVMTHCSRTGRVKTNASKILVEGRYSKAGKPLPNKLVSFGKGFGKTDCNEFYSDPANWLPVLEEIPDLKLVIAHATGDKDIMLYMENKESWLSTAMEMALKYENVYIDLSYVSNKDFVREFIIREILSKIDDRSKALAKKIIFGTDFYMSLISKAATRMVNDSLKDYGPYLQQIALENTMRVLKPKAREIIVPN